MRVVVELNDMRAAVEDSHSMTSRVAAWQKIANQGSPCGGHAGGQVDRAYRLVHLTHDKHLSRGAGDNTSGSIDASTGGQNRDIAGVQVQPSQLAIALKDQNFPTDLGSTHRANDVRCSSGLCCHPG